MRSGRVLPEPDEAPGRQRSVLGRVLNVDVPHVELDGSGIDPLGGQDVAAGMAQHVRMDREGQARLLSRPRDDLAHHARGQRSSPVAEENIGRRIVRIAQFPELPQEIDFRIAQRVGRVHAALEAEDVKDLLREIQLLPFQCHRLADAKRMPVHHADH